MSALKQHEIYSSKIENNEGSYLDAAIAIKELIKEGHRIKNDGEPYRFSLSNIMRRLDDSNIKISRMNAARVVHALLTRIDPKYFSTPGDGHPKYEIKIDKKKFEEIERWFQDINISLGYRSLFS